MTDRKECKGCSATVHHSFEDIRGKMAEYLETIAPDQRAEMELYEKRLAQCTGCSGLYYESTCRHCGCFVQMRAMRKTADCPCPEGSKWLNL